MSPKALRGEFVQSAKSAHTEPVRPSWKNILMIAIVARRPFANIAFNFAVIRPMLFHCVTAKPLFSMRPQKATIWNQPASGTLEKATKPFGTSENMMPTDGDR